jgi:hypothetical protein
MEIIKKNKKEHKLNDNDSIIKELLFAHTITQKKILPKEITQQIILNCVELIHKDIDNLPNITSNHRKFKKSFKETWFASDTPIIDYYFTTTQQKELMKKILETEATCIGQKITVDYFLDSPKEYKLFLTLPLNLRKNLTLLSQYLKNSVIKTRYSDGVLVIEAQSSYINADKTIQVRTTTAQVIALINQTYKGSHYCDSIPKPIVPEENLNHNHSKETDDIL